MAEIFTCQVESVLPPHELTQKVISGELKEWIAIKAVDFTLIDSDKDIDLLALRMEKKFEETGHSYDIINRNELIAPEESSDLHFF